MEIGHGETGKIIVFAKDKEGTVYRLPVTEVSREVFENQVRVCVSLPFKPDHKIWEELRNGNNK